MEPRPAVAGVRLIIGAGQSNMSGRGDLPDHHPLLEPHPHIWQFGATHAALVPATVPLDMHDDASGLSPLTVLAHHYAADHPQDLVLLVPAAHGGTGFSTSSAQVLPEGFHRGNPGGGSWQLDHHEPTNLATAMLRQVRAARTAAYERWHVAVSPTAFVWHQGEADTQSRATTYPALFRALVEKVRDEVAAPSMPVLIGGMVPEWVAADPIRSRVQEHLSSLPESIPHAAFVPGPTGCHRDGDLVHYGWEGARELGARYYRALTDLTGDSAPAGRLRAER